MHAVAELEHPAGPRYPAAHVVQQSADRGEWFRPHEEDVRLLRRDSSGLLREASKVESWTAARDGAERRRCEREVVELASLGDRVAVQQLAQDLHALPGSLVARL